MLFEGFSLRDLQLKNRVVMPPMCMYQSGSDGRATDWHWVHYTSRAVGGVGLIIVEATGVEPRGRITDRDLGLWDEAQIPGLQRIVASVHSQNGRIAIQLGHAGRKSEVPESTPVAPSAVAFSPKYRVPAALTAAEIQEISRSFAAAAGRAVRAGFDAIEIHAAHGYLLSEFLSPLANQRSDEYGGTPANRARFLAETVSAVRAAIPETMPLIVRVSASDYDPSGNTPEAMAELLNIVKERGVDLVDVSSGAITPVLPPVYPSYQIPLARIVKERTGLPVLGGGLVTEPLQAEQIVKSGVDLVFVGRELLRNPYWPLKAAAALHAEVDWPESYLRGKWE